MLRPALLMSLLLLVAAPVASGRPVAHATRACSLSEHEQNGGLGATYVLKLSAEHVSCSKAKEVVKAFHACRHEHGRAGHCGAKVKDYACTEKRGAASAVQYDSVATCTKGSKRVTHTYTQNT